jgi:hypothetical protein
MPNQGRGAGKPRRACFTDRLAGPKAEATTEAVTLGDDMDEVYQAEASITSEMEIESRRTVFTKENTTTQGCCPANRLNRSRLVRGDYDSDAEVELVA